MKKVYDCEISEDDNYNQQFDTQLRIKISILREGIKLTKKLIEDSWTKTYGRLDLDAISYFKMEYTSGWLMLRK